MIFEYDASFSKWVWCVTSLTDGKKTSCWIVIFCHYLKYNSHILFLFDFIPQAICRFLLYIKKNTEKNNIEEFKLNYYSMRVSCCHKQHKKQGFMKWVTGVCQYYSWPKPTNGFHGCPAEGAVDIKTDII